MPTLRPAASSTLRIMWAVVVLPLVPVTPIMVIRREGLPNRLALIRAMAWRLLATLRTVTPSSPARSMSCWMTRAAAPLAAQPAAKSWLSRWVPTMQTNSTPGAALRLS